MANEKNLTNRGGGRPKGSKNLVNKSIQEMLLVSLQNQGGIKFFDKLAVENPKVFAMLVGKLIPLQLIGGQNGEQPLQISVKLTKPGE
jgi:hypothetical protein